ncbi:MAG: response regulator, partial [Hyphomicrobiales bacterium]|nr:response regulator [Hyphomicrobiales bacterium]
LSGEILLVDDDPDFADGIRITLTEAGYSVLVVHTGHEAMDVALEKDFDVMLLDLRLPASNGLDVFVQLKEHNRGLPTVIITGYAAEEADAIDRLKQMSVSNCLTKPVRTDDLLQTLEQLFVEIQQ